MLPAVTNTRTWYEHLKRKGRSMEIERLIGRSLRSAVDMKSFRKNTITLDCDVLQVDGGTRIASITGAWVVLNLALQKEAAAGAVKPGALVVQVAAISLGKVGGKLLCDLDYSQDSQVGVDLNVVEQPNGGIVEIQDTGERSLLTRSELTSLLDMAEPALIKLPEKQREAVAAAGVQ